MAAPPEEVAERAERRDSHRRSEVPLPQHRGSSPVVFADAAVAAQGWLDDVAAPQVGEGGRSPSSGAAVEPAVDGEQRYSAMRRESLLHRRGRPGTSGSESPYADALFDEEERPAEGPFEGVPGEYYVQDVDRRYRRVRDPTSDVFAASGVRVPLYVVHGAPPRRLTPARVHAATRARSPMGCARFNPYCTACRLKYNLVFVDVHMRPVRWPSPRARALEALGDCRMHSGMLLSSGAPPPGPPPDDGRFVPVDYVDVRAPAASRAPTLVPAWQAPPDGERALRRQERHLRRRMKRLLWEVLPHLREGRAWDDYAALLDEGVELLQGLERQRRAI
ncbi:hypothetical protein STCU_12136 [Strigomonas culicis]|uniref:Uncharacterized protein n=1 Tax=Strigomonas culicis TaxID=28005 RepID=S9TBB6_9TRYP|nr:hypothetical protein STCU_12136 [Strigomonas culicis]|eukprot:EPY15307.1 hypothetical protein STCU_12136 [Strigomonas culicis]